MRRAAVLIVACAALAGCGGHDAPQRPATTPTPAPRKPVETRTPARQRGLAAQLDAAHAATSRAVEAWRASGTRSGPPPAVRRPARTEQRIYARLARHPRLAKRVIGRLDRDRREARDVVGAQAALHVLNAPQRTKRARRMVRLQRAEPAAALVRHYREGQRRSGVPWSLLAAVNFVESDFGRLRNDSIAGAQGPMQFIPSTWASYGRGGDVHDPRDAILGAARFLRAAGAPGDVPAALRAYNPSELYVTAVTHYEHLIARDPGAFYALYAWAPPVAGKAP